jgi:shikimate kinase
MPKETIQKTQDHAKLIFLVGMPAAGKTYWGDKIAAAHKFHFIDLDLFIAEQEKASISALFAKYGENGFREREHKHLKKLIDTAITGTVIACGGGTPCFHDNMQIMKSAGTVLYIRAEIPVLVEHLNESTEVRPLLNNRGDLPVYLEGMLHKRKGFYEQAHFILDTKTISIANFDEILS